MGCRRRILAIGRVAAVADVGGGGVAGADRVAGPRGQNLVEHLIEARRGKQVGDRPGEDDDLLRRQEEAWARMAAEDRHALVGA